MKKQTCVRFGGVALGALAMMMAMTPAQAQEATPASDDTGAVADIIVTAQFRSQRLQDTPIAITAVSADTLDARSQTSVLDVGAFSPNVNLTSATSLNGNAVAAFIRGIGQSDSSFALEPGVGMYIDDVYYGTTFGAVFDLTDLDRVEVLRGPQGTLAGKNSIGGAVKLFSKKPDEAGGGYVEATYGRYNRIDVRASADFKIAEGLFARVSGVEKHVDGFFKELDFGCANPGQGIDPSPQTGGGNCVIGHEGGRDLQAARVALRYAPAGSPLEINLIGDVAIDKSDAVPTKLVYANNPTVRSYVAGDPTAGIPFDDRFITGKHSYTSYATFSNGGNYDTVFGFPTQVLPGTYTTKPDNTARSYGFSGTIDYALGDNLSLKSITAYRQASGHNGIDVDGSPLSILLESYYQRHKQFTQELRLSGKVGDLVDFTVGGYYYDAHDLLRNRIQIPNVLFDFLSDDPVRNRSESVFAHGELHLADGLNLVGGLRYTHDKKTYTFSRRNIDGTLPSGDLFTPNFTVAGLDGLSATYKKGHVDYRIGVNYRWNDALMTYAQVSTGYKGGGVNPRPYVPDQVTTFGPEKLTAYEAGFKADLFDRLLRLNGALFYNDYKDIQLTLYRCENSASLTCSMPANAGNAHVKGAELEVLANPVQGLTIDGSLGYLDFKYTSVNPATNVTIDMIAPFNNKWQASAGIQYEADLGGSGTITPRLDWAYQSSFYYNAINNPYNRIDGRSIFNGRLSYESADKDWTVSLAVTNLFDKFYYVGANENMANYGVVTDVVGRPREWSLTVKRSF
ncbi:MAG TPA: TonB-dependent receptor [Sphingomonadaceae bacterium]|nr:TonB-dependent receptor [Sphingomonadaceae bacterium]